MSKRYAVALHETNNFFSWEMLCPLEHHMLGEMCNAPFIILFDSRTCLNEKLEECTVCYILRTVHVICQSIVKYTFSQSCILWNCLLINEVGMLENWIFGIFCLRIHRAAYQTCEY